MTCYVGRRPSRVFIMEIRRKCSYVEVEVYADSTTRCSTSKPRATAPSRLSSFLCSMADLRSANPRASHGRRGGACRRVTHPPCHRFHLGRSPAACIEQAWDGQPSVCAFSRRRYIPTLTGSRLGNMASLVEAVDKVRFGMDSKRCPIVEPRAFPDHRLVNPVAEATEHAVVFVPCS